MTEKREGQTGRETEMRDRDKGGPRQGEGTERYGEGDRDSGTQIVKKDAESG